MKIICDFSVFYLDETLPKGSIVIECGNALLQKGYKLKIFNTINFSKSMKYNPMAYIHSEKDIGEGVVVHRLFEVNGVQNPDLVAVFQKCIPTLDHDTTFGLRPDRTIPQRD